MAKWMHRVEGILSMLVDVYRDYVVSDKDKVGWL